jgi:hypothetical protein
MDNNNNETTEYKGFAAIEPCTMKTMDFIDNNSFKQNGCYQSKTHPIDFARSVSRIYAQTHVIVQSLRIEKRLLDKLSVDQTITINLKELEEIISWRDIKYN